MIATTVGGTWFAFLDSFDVVALMTQNGVEPVSYPERLALRQILGAAADDPEG